MRKLFLSLILLGLISFVIFYFVIRPSIVSDIKNTLAASGYKIEHIEKERVNLSGISLSNISLTEAEFNTIDQIDIDVAWHLFLSDPVQKITIQNLKYSSVYSTDLAYDSYRMTEKIKSSLSTSQISQITLNNFTWDVSTPLGSIRLTGDLFINKSEGETSIKANIDTAQHSLSFKSEIVGRLSNNEEKWDLSILDWKVNSALVNLSRANGWFSYLKSNNQDEFSGQIDIGSSKIFNAPLSNLQLITARKLNEPHIPVVLRAQLSGIKNSSLIADIQLSPTIENQDFKLKIMASEKDDFITYLKDNNFLNKETETSLILDGGLTLELQHMKERRFADGPYPFSFDTAISDKKLNGTFIFYPESLTVRGSAEGNKSLLTLANEILMGTPLEKNQNTIRFEKNLIEGQLLN